MNRQLTLRTSLLLIFAIGLVLVTAVQLLTRVVFELPDQYAQEHRTDIEMTALLRHTLDVELTRKQAIAEDNAHWDYAHAFMGMAPGGEAYQRFIEEEFAYTYTMHVVPRVDGYRYYDQTDDIFFESVIDAKTEEPGIPASLPLQQLKQSLGTEPGAVISGFIHSTTGPLLVVLTAINNDALDATPSGHLAVWQRVDAAYFSTVSGSEAIQFELLKAGATDPRIAAIQTAPGNVLPRGERGYVQWLLPDIFGTPLYLVTHPTTPRAFNDSIVSRADVAGLATTVLLLAAFALLISRRVIAPIEDLSVFIRSVARSEDFSLRPSINRNDEIGVVARYFDRLLDLVETQDQTLKEQNRELLALAENDPLTGITNRRVFDRVLKRDWALAQRSERPISCIILDVDWFGRYNEHYGHPAGDAALQDIAKILQAKVNRETDTLCRYGGEEFAVLLNDTNYEAAKNIARKLIDAVSSLDIAHEGSETAMVITASAGVATLMPAPGDSAHELVLRADNALYRAKSQGRNQFA